MSRFLACFLSFGIFFQCAQQGELVPPHITPNFDLIRHIVCKLQYNVLYLSIHIKIYNYGTGNIINES